MFLAKDHADLLQVLFWLMTFSPVKWYNFTVRDIFYCLCLTKGCHVRIHGCLVVLHLLLQWLASCISLTVLCTVILWRRRGDCMTTSHSAREQNCLWYQLGCLRRFFVTELCGLNWKDRHSVKVHPLNLELWSQAQSPREVQLRFSRGTFRLE